LIIDHRSPAELHLKAIARIDLVRLAASLEREGQHPDLVSAIGRAAAAGSTREDLRGAQASLKLINDLQDRSDATSGPVRAVDENNTIIGALFTQAVILYARATTTKGARPKLLGEAKLCTADRATHIEALGMRNSAIAHFGRGEALPGGPLVKEAVILSLFASTAGRKKQVGVYTTRAQHKVAFAARLAGLIDARLADLETRYQGLFDEADAALERAVRADPALGRSLPRFEFDVGAFCESRAAADHLRAQLEAGTVDDMSFAVEVPKP